MRRILLLAVCSLLTSVLLAGPVTKEQAQQVASQFLQDRAAASGSHRAAADLQTSYSGEVSGLYVFNVVGNNGFVIISNDDCAEPVLGYADSGSFDLNNIPDNMRAWLQGYADEIAWAKSHGVKKRADSTARRAGSVKTVINPLVQTQWDQSAPYNNLCPEYTSGKHSVTGCVATAMAQVMYYYQWPTAVISAEIPAYDKDFNNQNVRIPLASNLPIITFDWENMQTKYTGAETNAQNTAVAQLMYYAGCSVRMDYGSSSGANTAKAADALKTYFNYEETTVSTSRSFYTYANWIDMLYNELKNNRVVLYSGTSTGGGHAFICDGYETEDYFHINWGWGGQSDGHFKLSALDSDYQGIGGSTSTDGYNYMQSAIVGIQRKGKTGTVLNVAQTPNLKLNSTTLSSSSTTQGVPVDITFNITNNGSYDYDGDIYVFVNGIGIETGKNFVIPAGTTKDCVISYSPSGYTGTASVTGAFPTSSGGYSYNPYTGAWWAELTVTGSAFTTTDNIALTAEVTSLENANAGKTELYTTTSNAVITITNPETDKNYSGMIYIYFHHGGGYSMSGKGVSIPANGSYKYAFPINNVTIGQTCYFSIQYQKNKAFTSETKIGGLDFTVQPGIITYTADGTKTAQKATPSFTAPTEALYVDVSGSSTVTAITPNSKQNTVYIYSGTKPSGLDGKNVIQKTGSNTYAAVGTISLTDKQDFYSPVDFTGDVEFTYNLDGKFADGSNGWNTLLLPFEVTKVTANGEEIHWFTSSTDTGKNFWVKQFSSDGASSVSFDFISESTLPANTPYIVAFPGPKWGTTWDMTGKTIKFIGQSVTVYKGSTISSVTGGNYRFIGSTTQDGTKNIYCINAAGSSFDLKATGGSPAFRAYFKPGIFDSTVTSLSIGGGGSATGISSIEQKATDDGQYYNLNGQRVSQPTKGLYIKNGKKVIVK